MGLFWEPLERHWLTQQINGDPLGGFGHKCPDLTLTLEQDRPSCWVRRGDGDKGTSQQNCSAPGALNNTADTGCWCQHLGHGRGRACARSTVKVRPVGPPDPSLLKSKITEGPGTAGQCGLTVKREGCPQPWRASWGRRKCVAGLDRRKAAVSAPAAISEGSAAQCLPQRKRNCLEVALEIKAKYRGESQCRTHPRPRPRKVRPQRGGTAPGPFPRQGSWSSGGTLLV